MPYPTIIERYGSLSATGIAKETTFGTPVVANAFLPMTDNTLDEDPGWFSPHVMQGQRDLQIYNLQGEAKFAGAITGPLFPSNAMGLLVASIGADAAPGYGVTGAAGSGSTTLSSGAAANATTISVGSSTGFATQQVIQIDTNNTATPTTSECRKITAISGAGPFTLTLDAALVYAHASGAAVAGVVAPYTHTINQANTLPSLTVEKNMGGFQSLQFAGCKVNKFDLKAPVGNNPIEITADVMGQSVATLNNPTAISIVNELPFVFSEATVNLYSGARADVSNVNIAIENGLKETYTYSQAHGPSFLTPVTLHVSGSVDVVWTSLTDSTYGDWTRAHNQTLGAMTFTLTHPASAGTVTINLPQIALSKFAGTIKMEDVITAGLTFEASRPQSGTSQYTISATVVNNAYIAY